MPFPRINTTRRAAVAIAAALIAAFMWMNAGYFKARLAWALFGPAPVSVGAVVPAPVVGAPDIALPRIAPDRVIIPSLGLDAPLVYVGEAKEAVFQEALQGGVVHYPGTALPGQRGNAYYFGHSSDYFFAKGDYKTVFATLTEIKVGDTVTVSDAEGRPFTYVVTGTRVVSPKDLSVLGQHGHKKTLLTLQTSYPLGTALKRFLVEAEMAE